MSTVTVARGQLIAPGALLAALFLVAVNLRAPLGSLPPLVPTIEDVTGMGSAASGALTALPVLCMGLFAPLGHRLGHRFGREAAVAGALAVIGVGTLLRLGGEQLALLYGGTFLLGIGIAVGGTLLPGIVKEFFAERAGLATGIYMLAMMLGATAGAVLAVPIADWLGSWPASLAGWSALAAVGLVAWIPVARRVNERNDDDVTPAGRLPWRSATAWLVAGYLVLQSTQFYSQLAWLAPTYESLGRSDAVAGLLLGAFAGTQMISGVGAPVLVDRFRDPRWLLLPSVVCTLVGAAAVAAIPESVPLLWAILLGVGQGAGFALGLTLLVDYAGDPADSARLTAMTFLISYSVAALGPLGLGAVRDLTGGFTASWVALTVMSAVQLGITMTLRPGRRV